MPLLNFTSWEVGADGEEALQIGNASVVNTLARTGDYSLEVSSSGSGTHYAYMGDLIGSGDGYESGINFPTAYATSYFYIDTLPSSGSECILAFVNTRGGVVKEFRITSTGTIDCYSFTGVKLGTGTTVLSTGQWYRLDFGGSKDLTGVYELKIDHLQEYIDNGPGGAANIDGVAFGIYKNRSSQTCKFYYDDVTVLREQLYMSDGVHYASDILKVTGNGDGGWIGDYTDFDDHPGDDGTTTAITTAIIRAESGTCESMQDIGAAKPSSVLAVKVYGKTRFSVLDPGHIPSVRQYIQVSGSKSETSNNTLNSINWVTLQWMSETDPNTSSAWLESGVDAAEAGIRMSYQTGSAVAQCTVLNLHVLYVPGPDRPNQYNKAHSALTGG